MGYRGTNLLICTFALPILLDCGGDDDAESGVGSQGNAAASSGNGGGSSGSGNATSTGGSASNSGSNAGGNAGTSGGGGLAGGGTPEAGGDGGNVDGDDDGGSDDGGGGTPCGNASCDTSSEICVACNCGGPTTFSCEPVPSQCANDRGCGCVAQSVCTGDRSGTCSNSSDNAVLCETGRD